VDEAGQLGSYRETETRPDRAIQMLAREFHPRSNGRSFATAHLLVPVRGGRFQHVPTVADFSWGEAEEIHIPPVTFAVPYACDFDNESLWFTVHPLPSAVLSADSVLQEQRRQACVGCRVDLRHLHRFYPIGTQLPPVSFLLIKDASERAEATRRLRGAGRRVVADPSALMQLAMQSNRFFKLRRRWWDSVLWATIAPAFVAYGGTFDPVLFVVSEEILSLRGVLQSLLVETEFFNSIAEAENGMSGEV
jgi:hypothetical protein